MIVTFVRFCGKENLDIQSLSIDSSSSTNGTYTFKASFGPTSSGLPQPSIDKSAIKTVFMNHQKNITPKVILENTTFVGKISEKEFDPIMYKKNTDGKIIGARRVP